MFKWENWTNDYTTISKEELQRKMSQALNEIEFHPPLPCPIADKCLASLTKIETMLNKIRPPDPTGS